MKPLKGLEVSPYLVCKLKKPFYGRKQASLQWFAKPTTELTHQSFLQYKMITPSS